MRRCDKHGHDRLPGFSCPACVLDERDRLQAENEALREALLELYRWCNNVEIRGEGLHQGPIFFSGPVFGERTQEDDHRFDALQSAEEALAAHESRASE